MESVGNLSSSRQRLLICNFLSSAASLQCGVHRVQFYAPLGSIFRKHGISFHCYANESQIYFPLKKINGLTADSLFRCLGEIKVWVGLMSKK